MSIGRAYILSLTWANGTLKQTDLSKLPTRKGFFKETMKMKYLALHALPDISEAEEDLEVCIVNRYNKR